MKNPCCFSQSELTAGWNKVGKLQRKSMSLSDVFLGNLCINLCLLWIVQIKHEIHIINKGKYGHFLALEWHSVLLSVERVEMERS